MAGPALIIILVVGAIAGWLAGQIVKGIGFGIIGDLIIGIFGAFIGSCEYAPKWDPAKKTG